MENGEQKLKLNFPDDHTEVYPEKKNTISKYIGVFYIKKKSWYVQRWSTDENKKVSNGCYNDAKTAARASDTLARKLMKNGKQKLQLNFPDDHTEVYPEKKDIASKFIGVSYKKEYSKWGAQRWNTNEKKNAYNGYYVDEETAAHASDTLARKLMENGEQKLKLNFPDNHTEVYPEKKNITSKYFGVFYIKNKSKWGAQRWSTVEKKNAYNGYYDNEETAAHASDTLARNLMKIGEQNHKLNFPDDHNDVYPEQFERSSCEYRFEKRFSSKFIGVNYNKRESKWYARRWSKSENKTVYNGIYDDEETAAHASDTLARELIANGEKGHKLNYPDDDTEVYRENQNNKRKRLKN